MLSYKDRRKAGQGTGLLGRAPALRTAFVCLCFALLSRGSSGGTSVRFLPYPDFPQADSSWGSIGYSSRYNKVYIGVTNHRDRQGLFEYDVASGKLRLCGFVDEMGHLRPFEWQGKIHTQIVEGPDGAMYFGTDGGESREEDLKEHPHGYGGGFFFKWDPQQRHLTNLGMALPYEGLKDIAVDHTDGTLFAVSYPQVHLLTYDTPKNTLTDLGRVGSGHVPRVIFTDKWSNIYYVDWRQRLIKYEHDTKKLLFNRDSLPAFPGTPGLDIITGITAWASDSQSGTVYLITYGAKMLAFHPQRHGIGTVEDLGGIYDDPDRPPYIYYCPNLALHKNGKLYYFIGGHGSHAGRLQGTTLMEFDPRTRQKRVLGSYPLNVLTEATGSDVKDRDGNLYFAGRRDDPTVTKFGESGGNRPFLIIVHPEGAIN
ncbi:MAG: hypothetical protein M3Y57_09505 [Acidobacteriota bacterium]|nr:hypothetical protein [Acidobacteriota bacterium]